MKILIWNINSLGPTVRNFVLTYGSLKGFFEEHGADVVCLQETKFAEGKVPKDIACVEGFESFWAFSKDKTGYSGIVSYVAGSFSPMAAEADSLESLDGNKQLNREGRLVVTDLGHFVLLNVYVPNAGGRERERAAFKATYLRALTAKVDALLAAGREVAVVGDLNMAASQADVYSKLDWGAMYGPEEKGAFEALLRRVDDTWRRLHPTTTDVYTVFDERTNARPFNQGVRIDYVLLSPGLQDRVASCEVISTPPKWSDHVALLLELRDIPPVPAHPPCALSSLRNKLYYDRLQPSVAALFGAQRLAAKRKAGAKEGEGGRDRALKQGSQESGECSASQAQPAKRHKAAADVEAGSSLENTPGVDEAMGRPEEAVVLERTDEVPLEKEGSGVQRRKPAAAVKSGKKKNLQAADKTQASIMTFFSKPTP